MIKVLSGWLSIKFGGKIVLGISMLLGSLLTILAAPSAKLGFGVLILCRFITGLAHVYNYFFIYIFF